MTPRRQDPGSPADPWILLFAGVSKDGARRAEFVYLDAVAQGFDVVLFDGSGYEYPQLPEDVRENAKGRFVDYSVAEMKTFGARLSKLGKTSIGRMIRRIGSLGRGRAGWRLIRRRVQVLAEAASTPERIIYCDDWAVVPAWHSTRLWPMAPASPLLSDQ